jgi:hypothetical protein
LLHFDDLGIGRSKINISSQTEVEYEIEQDQTDEPELTNPWRSD